MSATPDTHAVSGRPSRTRDGPVSGSPANCELAVTVTCPRAAGRSVPDSRGSAVAVTAYRASRITRNRRSMPSGSSPDRSRAGSQNGPAGVPTQAARGCLPPLKEYVGGCAATAGDTESPSSGTRSVRLADTPGSSTSAIPTSPNGPPAVLPSTVTRRVLVGPGGSRNRCGAFRGSTG